MKKKDLINELEEALRTEEESSAIYAQHIHALSERLDLDKKFIKEFKLITEQLIKFNKQHKVKCEELINNIKKDKRDDF